MHINVGLLVLYYIISGKNKRLKYFLGRTLETLYTHVVLLDIKGDLKYSISIYFKRNYVQVKDEVISKISTYILSYDLKIARMTLNVTCVVNLCHLLVAFTPWGGQWIQLEQVIAGSLWFLKGIGIVIIIIKSILTWQRCTFGSAFIFDYQGIHFNDLYILGLHVEIRQIPISFYIEICWSCEIGHSNGSTWPDFKFWFSFRIL